MECMSERDVNRVWLPNRCDGWIIQNEHGYGRNYRANENTKNDSFCMRLCDCTPRIGRASTFRQTTPSGKKKSQPVYRHCRTNTHRLRKQTPDGGVCNEKTATITAGFYSRKNDKGEANPDEIGEKTKG